MQTAGGDLWEVLFPNAEVSDEKLSGRQPLEGGKWSEDSTVSGRYGHGHDAQGPSLLPSHLLLLA